MVWMLYIGIFVIPMTEVILDDDRSLKIDLIGWCTETGKIIGVEVKRSINDFTKKRNVIRSYSQYCDELYIMTDNKRVRNKARVWIEENGYKNISVLYVNEERKILSFTPGSFEPNLCGAKNRLKSLQEVKEAFGQKCAKAITGILWGDDILFPEQALSKVIATLKEEFSYEM